MSGLGGIIMDSPGGSKGMCAYQLRVEQPLLRQALTSAHGEGAGAVRLARDIGGNCEACADPETTAPLKDALLPGIQRQQSSEFRPKKADIGSDARMMDGIVVRKVLGDQFLCPFRRIIIYPEKWTCAPLKAGMVEEREVAKAKLESNVAKQTAQIRVTCTTAGLLLE